MPRKSHTMCQQAKDRLAHKLAAHDQLYGVRPKKQKGGDEKLIALVERAVSLAVSFGQVIGLR